jgi:thiamine-phosphate pyrophosphorylase
MRDDLARILDANANRAREALRVIEDYARFALDDGPAASALKHARHDLRTVVAALGGPALLAQRDIIADVGRETKAAGELERRCLEDVVRAAFARLGEALRVISEYGKLRSTAAAQSAETLRYRAYELEQMVMLRGAARARLRAVRLYVIVTESLCRGDWQTVAVDALRGGAKCLQLREKGLADRELLARAVYLRELTARHDALLVINDRPDIAGLVGADGMHVGQDDLSVRDARRIAGARMLIGKSTHDRAQFEAALAEEPDYIAIGPMFPSATKPQEHVAGVATLAWAVDRAKQVHAANESPAEDAPPQTAPGPLLAIGGITPENAAEVWAAGADCVCACAAVIGAGDPQVAAAALLRARDGAAPVAR